MSTKTKARQRALPAPLSMVDLVPEVAEYDDRIAAINETEAKAKAKLDDARARYAAELADYRAAVARATETGDLDSVPQRPDGDQEVLPADFFSSVMRQRENVRSARRHVVAAGAADALSIIDQQEREILESLRERIDMDRLAAECAALDRLCALADEIRRDWNHAVASGRTRGARIENPTSTPATPANALRAAVEDLSLWQ